MILIAKHWWWRTSQFGPTDNELDPRSGTTLEPLLHAHPEEAAQLEYVRVHTGFARKINVTDADLERVAQ